ncbi:MAG: hydroxymyristoyl-ACP dehydratase [Stenotrophobium sp.]
MDEPETFRSSVVIAASHPALDGHFPGNPIVPGVLLLEAVADALREWRGIAASGFPNVKFISPLRPGERMEIIFSGGDGAAPLRFRCECAGRLLAQGSIAT